MEEEDGAVLMLMLVLCVLRGASPKGDAKLSFIGFRHKGHRPTSRPTGGGVVRRVLKLDVRRIGKARAGIRRAAFGGAAAPREGGAEALCRALVDGFRDAEVPDGGERESGRGRGGDTHTHIRAGARDEARLQAFCLYPRPRPGLP